MFVQFNTKEIIIILIKSWYTKLIIKDKYVCFKAFFNFGNIMQINI